MSTEVPEILLSHYLKTLKLPTFQREYQKLSRLSASPDRAVREGCYCNQSFLHTPAI